MEDEPKRISVLVLPDADVRDKFNDICPRRYMRSVQHRHYPFCPVANIRKDVSLQDVYLPVFVHLIIFSGLQWSNAYLLWIVVLPVLSTALQMGFSIKHDALKQIGFDNTFCDVTEPLWPKLLGWGGLPMMYTLASFVFTAYAVKRLQIVFEAHCKLWHDISNQVEFAPRPPTDSKDVDTRAQTLLPDTLEEREAVRLVTFSLDHMRAGDIEMKTAGPSSSSRAASATPYGSTDNITKGGSQDTASSLSTPLPPPKPPQKSLPVDGDVSMYGTAPGRLTCIPKVITTC